MLLTANEDLSSTYADGAEEIESYGQPDEHHSSDENETCIMFLFLTLHEHLLLEVKGFILLVFLFNIVVGKKQKCCVYFHIHFIQ